MDDYKKAFRVVVVFEFGDIDDPNGVEADELVDEVTEETKRIVLGEWQSPVSSAAVWVEDAYVVDGIYRQPKNGYQGGVT